MNSSRRQLRGVLPVFQTPYHTDETIDVATLEKEIDLKLQASTAGVQENSTNAWLWSGAIDGPDLGRFGDYGRILKSHPHVYLAKDFAPPGAVNLNLKYRQAVAGM